MISFNSYLRFTVHLTVEPAEVIRLGRFGDYGVG